MKHWRGVENSGKWIISIECRRSIWVWKFKLRWVRRTTGTTIYNEFSNLEKLELECKEIDSPDKLGDAILDEIWNQFANQIGLDMTRWYSS